MIVGTKMNRLKLPAGMTLPEIERIVIEQTLMRHEGNRMRTAQALDLSPSTLYRRLRQYRKTKRRK